MKVLDLGCEHAHRFEGWFGSEDDFRSQLDRGLVECPLCGSKRVQKLLSAPRLNLGATAVSEANVPAAAGQEQAMVAMPAAAQGTLEQAWLKLVHHVLRNTEDVGPRFAEEARRIHHGESQERGIRGQASAEETQALLEEGITVLPLPIPKAIKGPVQ